MEIKDERLTPSTRKQRCLPPSRIEDTNIVEAKLDGKIKENKVETLRSEIGSVLSEHDKLRLLLVYEGLGKMDLQAIWEDIKLETSTVSSIERMAVVTEKSWLGSVAGAIGFGDEHGDTDLRARPARQGSYVAELLSPNARRL